MGRCYWRRGKFLVIALDASNLYKIEGVQGLTLRLSVCFPLVDELVKLRRHGIIMKTKTTEKCSLNMNKRVGMIKRRVDCSYY